MHEQQTRAVLVGVLLGCVLSGLACGSSAQPPATGAPASTSAPAGSAAHVDKTTPAASTPGDGGGTPPQLQPPADLNLERSPRIPLADGLTVVLAAVEELGDYEVVVRVSVPGSDRIQVSYSATLPVNGVPTELHGGRTVLSRDLQSARTYRLRWLSGRTELAQGTTALGLSKAVFAEVRKDGRSECSLASIEQAGTMLAALGMGSPEYEGVLERVEPAPVPVPMVVNGQREWLPAIHAKGTFEGLTGEVPAEFWFLDDADNPLTLRAVIGSGRFGAVRIDCPRATADNRLEKALAGDEAVDLAGVYFEFASARLRAESDAAIAEAASVLRRHADWKVRLEGHTDSIGTADANLALSRARAATVRQAILDRLGGGAARVEAAGFGQTRPRESNATPEGRARNRRVEIVRMR